MKRGRGRSRGRMGGQVTHPYNATGGRSRGRGRMGGQTWLLGGRSRGRGRSASRGRGRRRGRGRMGGLVPNPIWHPSSVFGGSR